MAMRDDRIGKGGTTMVELTNRWIDCRRFAAVPACPREELVRRR